MQRLNAASINKCVAINKETLAYNPDTTLLGEEKMITAYTAESHINKCLYPCLLEKEFLQWLVLGPVYTKCQRQRCDNSAMMLQNGFAMRTESLASSQSDHSVGGDAWCKRALRVNLYQSEIDIASRWIHRE